MIEQELIPLVLLASLHRIVVNAFKGTISLKPLWPGH
jgi:hypothetical protein